MTEKLRVARVARTCVAMPSQWDITLEGGRSLYARYRGGCYYVAYEPLGRTIFEGSRGSRFDGDMSNEELVWRTAPLLDWTNAVWDTPFDTDETTETPAIEAFFSEDDGQ